MAFLSKATLLAAAAALLATATPALARHRDRDGSDAAAIIAGALVIGGIAAIAGSSNRDRYDDGYRSYRPRYQYRYHGSYRHHRHDARPRYRYHRDRHDRYNRGRAAYGY